MNRKYSRKPRKKNKNSGLTAGFLAVALISGCIGFYLGTRAVQVRPAQETDIEDRPTADNEPVESSGLYDNGGEFRFGSQGLSQEDLELLKLSRKEELVGFVAGDTDRDGKEEILAIVENTSQERGRIYVIDDDGSLVYEKESAMIIPDKAELRVFEDDIHPSYFLIFKEQYKEGYFIRHNGKKYEVPESEKE